MKIVHISTADINGGAARAAYRLHKGLIEAGIDSKMFVRDKHSPNDGIIRYKYPVGLKKTRYYFKRSIIQSDYGRYKLTRPKGLELLSDDRSPCSGGFIKQLPQADIYNLHWTSAFLDFRSFFRKINKPVVWTLHDMWPFTGGCHYTNGCSKYSAECGACPQLGSVEKNDLSSKILKRKKQALAEFGNRLVIKADSNWLAREARQSALFKGFNVETIHYGVETNEFYPRSKSACREALGIPLQKKVIVYGAPDVSNPRKGFSQLNEALKLLKTKMPDLFLLSFGSGMQQEADREENLHLGYINDNNLLSIVYNCGDVFVIPSLEEAFGQTALEAMSSGVPVVGFNTGGIPDMIQEGKTGFLAEKGDHLILAEKIRVILSMDDEKIKNLGFQARQLVLSEFTIRNQALSYHETYLDLLK